VVRGDVGAHPATPLRGQLETTWRVVCVGASRRQHSRPHQLAACQSVVPTVPTRATVVDVGTVVANPRQQCPSPRPPQTWPATRRRQLVGCGTLGAGCAELRCAFL